MSKYNHLALVRRDEVVELFKNGVIYPSSSVQFSGSVEAFSKNTKEVKKIFAKTPAIDYSINFFFLYAESDNKSSLSTKGLYISDLVEIIPLDEESARMGLPLTPPIRLSRPIFENNYLNYQEKAAIENARKGVQNISAIFGMKDLWKSVKKITEKKHLPIFVSLIIDESGRCKPNTIWEYLLCYNRNQTYPNGVHGAFLDTMSVVQNYTKGCIDFKDQKQTTTGKRILKHESPSYNTLTECLSTSTNFVKAADKAYKDFWKIAPLYFILLDLFEKVSEDGTSINGTSIHKFTQSVAIHYDETHLKPALLMLGITLGQSSTYKMLYAVNKDKFKFFA